MNFEDFVRTVSLRLRSLPTHWRGKRAILEMQRAGSSQWRQMEWIGFYFQFLCERHLRSVVQIPGPRYGSATFDGFKVIPWDFKAHAINTTSQSIIVNDSTAIAQAIRKYGAVGVILASGEVDYNDRRRSFQRWHESLKGGPSAYVRARIRRGAWSRLRKTAFNLKEITFVKISDKTLIRCGSFQSDFRNSDGRPRRPKVLLDLEKLTSDEITYRLPVRN